MSDRVFYPTMPYTKLCRSWKCFLLYVDMSVLQLDNLLESLITFLIMIT